MATAANRMIDTSASLGSGTLAANRDPNAVDADHQFVRSQGSYTSVTETIDVCSSRHTDFCDVTEAIEAVVRASAIVDGVVLIYSQHTTARVHINEHEPLLLADLTHLLERLVPRDGFYNHDDFSVRTVNLTPGERINGHSHCRGMFMGVSEQVPVSGGQLMLGRWQRIFMVELDGPQNRQVVVKVMGIA